MQSPTLTARTTSPTYFELNNQLNIPKDGQIQLDKDKDAVRAYFLEYVSPNIFYGACMPGVNNGFIAIIAPEQRWYNT